MVSTLSTARPLCAMPVRVRIEEVLGQGGQAVVFGGWRVGALGFERAVAVKVARRDPTSEHLLQQEACLLSALHHPNILAVDELVRLEGSLVLLMERVAGPDLRRVARCAARRGEASVRAALEVGRDIAAALAHLDGLRLPDAEGPVTVVHRDVKPANILVDSAGSARLADFGVAERLDVADPTGELIVGTRGYMAPELAGGGPASPASDVFALGATVLELLLRRRLRARTAPQMPWEDVVKVAFAQLPYASAPARMGEVARLLMAMLDPDPARRPRASEVGAVFRTLVHDAPGLPLQAWSALAERPGDRGDPMGWVGRELSSERSTRRGLGGALVCRQEPRTDRPAGRAGVERTDLTQTSSTLGVMAALPPVPPVVEPWGLCG